MTNLEVIEEVERQIATFMAVYLTKEQVDQLRSMTNNSGMPALERGWEDTPIWHRVSGKTDFVRGIKNYYISLNHARTAVHAARVYLARHVAETLTK